MLHQIVLRSQFHNFVFNVPFSLAHCVGIHLCYAIFNQNLNFAPDVSNLAFKIFLINSNVFHFTILYNVHTYLYSTYIIVHKHTWIMLNPS